MKTRSFSGAVVVAATTCLSAPGWAAGIPGGYASAVVFGDSISDTGRVRDDIAAISGGAVTYPPEPYFDGRFTNGPNYIDRLQVEWGLTPEVDLYNYAYGGASARLQGDIVRDFGEQVRDFVTDGAPGRPAPLVWSISVAMT